MIKHFREVDTDDIESYGGKGTTLSLLYQSGFNVPEGFIIPHHKLGNVQTIDREDGGIIKFLDEIESDFVAVRSSANVEDDYNSSFAGLFESYIVRKEEIIEAIRNCYSSLKKR